MNKRLLLIIGGLLLLIVSIFIWILLEDSFLYELEGQGANAPQDAGSYEKLGYYKIDPRIILASLESGKTDVFTPLPADEALDSLPLEC
jgi:hypothetical protein